VTKVVGKETLFVGSHSTLRLIVENGVAKLQKEVRSSEAQLGQSDWQTLGRYLKSSRQPSGKAKPLTTSRLVELKGKIPALAKPTVVRRSIIAQIKELKKEPRKKIEHYQGLIR
jgi:hypothetical protein